MDKDDLKLNALLDNYQVNDADGDLLDRIVNHAKKQPTNVVRLPLRQREPWLKNVALIAATAVLGFWYGNSTIEPVNYRENPSATASQASYSSNLDNELLGPKSYSEVML